MTVMTKTELTGTNYVANANTGAIGSANHRNFVESVFGCYAQLRETTLSSPGVAVINFGASDWTEMRVYTGASATGSPFTAAASETLTTSTTTGRITIPAAALGTYRIGYQLYLQPSAALFNSSTAFTPPDLVAFDIRKDGTTSLGGLSVGQFKSRPYEYLTIPAAISATGLYFPTPPAVAMTAESLVVTSGTTITGGGDSFTAIQVTNRGTGGVGSTTLFATPKSTATDAITALIPRVWTFDQNTAVTAGQQLELTVTKNGNPANIANATVRGRAIGNNYSSETDLVLMQAETEEIISSAGYVSIGGFCLASTAGILTVRAASFWAERIG